MKYCFRFLKTLLIFCTLSFSQLISGVDFTIDTLKIKSDVLNEERMVLIIKPDRLEEKEPVTLLYLLDGEYSKDLFQKAFEDQHNNQLIGVAIINTDRRRDMLYANFADKFLEFIAYEMIPKVEMNYTLGSRVLFGHSFAGSFTIYSLSKKPGLFNKYIASSPTPIMDLIDNSSYKKLDKELDKEIKLYFSYGSKDMKQVKKWAEMLTKNLSVTTFHSIQWKNEIYQGKDHNSSDQISLEKGLRY